MSTNDRRLVLDATNTSITFEVRWFGVLPIRGTFSRLHGVLDLGTEGVTHSTLRIDVEAASVATGIALRDRHLRGPRFLFADLHPFISFKSGVVRREHGRLVVEGTLSLRGTEATACSTCPLDETDNGSSSIDLCGEFVVSRRHFDVGVARGLAGRNPLLLAIADAVRVRVRLQVPAERLLPVLQAAGTR